MKNLTSIAAFQILFWVAVILATSTEGAVASLIRFTLNNRIDDPGLITLDKFSVVTSNPISLPQDCKVNNSTGKETQISFGIFFEG